MKTFTTLLLSICIMTVFTQCAGSQFINNPPFELESATKHRVVKNSIDTNEIIIKTVFNKVDTEVVSFNKFYFDNRSFDVTATPTGNTVVLEAKYSPFGKERNLILHKDPKKEFGNKPPAPVEKIPFDLKEGEMVIAYTNQGKTNFFKIKNIQEGDTIIYP